MKGFLPLISVIALLHGLACGSDAPNYFERSPTTPRRLDANRVRRELGSRVSKATTIFGPEDSRYEIATSRYSTFAPPNVQVVVVPGKESDVSTIVKFCNRNSIEFLTVNRGHGWTKTLGTFKGIQIDLENLQNVDIQRSGRSAWFGGGTYAGPVAKYLWDRGYVTTTGSCDCVGLMGPGLGGGHGRLEGLYGLISDNVVQFNVVLANGASIRVSKSSHSDLFWALRGAGHGFGIVTSFEMNIFPRGPETWHYHNYYWRGDKLEAVFDALNKLHGNGTTPVDMAANFGGFSMNASITDKEPIIMWTFAYRGSAKAAERYLAPFNAIEAVSETFGDVPYPSVAAAQLQDEDSVNCRHNVIRVTSAVGLQVYNLTAERQIFEAYKKRVPLHPQLAAGASVFHEGYATAGMQAKNPMDSAYPFRDDNHLMLFSTVVPPDNATARKAALEWADEVRDQWRAGQPDRSLNVYLNYATGFETLDQIYGHEDWRLKRLRQLKKKYDPFNRFHFYNPVNGRNKG
ncbi:hypothetical protein CkaCkLH20_10784 [Colletotrichum karsti]|uniref:FAD-binding PCMH-type domain-containing protein n=1 Tax=Colletotrichum karsti TaxID=1095194 RepID=A0A9P6HXC4_9PEZI|nr:uncharacterized protein CkaCkLH20_10784 [Colletotrichum karsti]KAF9871850.1 hypothetical protein CkaCkLH20_10784 [Colletotrichum karsti]